MISSDEELVARFTSNADHQYSAMKRTSKLLNVSKKHSRLHNSIIFLLTAVLTTIVFVFGHHFELVLFYDGDALPPWAAWIAGLSSGLFVVFMLIVSIFISRRNYQNNLFAHIKPKTVEFRLTPSGLSFESEDSSGRWGYSAIDQVVEWEGGINIRLGVLIYSIPSGAFASPEIKEKFIARLREFVPDERFELSTATGPKRD